MRHTDVSPQYLHYFLLWRTTLTPTASSCCPSSPGRAFVAWRRSCAELLAHLPSVPGRPLPVGPAGPGRRGAHRRAGTEARDSRGPRLGGHRRSAPCWRPPGSTASSRSERRIGVCAGASPPVTSDTRASGTPTSSRCLRRAGRGRRRLLPLRRRWWRDASPSRSPRPSSSG